MAQVANFPKGAKRSTADRADRRALLESALARGAKPHWYDEGASGWLRLPGSGDILWVTPAEVVACYRRLLAL